MKRKELLGKIIPPTAERVPHHSRRKFKQFLTSKIEGAFKQKHPHRSAENTSGG